MPQASHTKNSTNAKREEQIRNRIIEGARKCFKKAGAKDTTMADIANSSGIARSGVYRYFATHREIVESVVLVRLTELIEGIMPSIGNLRSFRKALLVGSIEIINVGRNDKEIQQIFRTNNDVNIIDFLAGKRPKAHEIVRQFWSPILAKGRASKELRDDISDDDVIEWLRSVYLMLILRAELDEKHEKYLLEKFLLHSVLTPGTLK